MSSSTYSFALLGGVPTSEDVAPSGIYLVFYVLLFLGLVFRAISPLSRSKILIRVFIFVLARVGAFATRLTIALDRKSNKAFSTSLVTAEVILFMAGFVAIIEPCFALTASLISPLVRGPLARIVQLIRLALIAVIAIIITAAINLSSANDTDPNKWDLMRHVGYGILVAVPVISTVMALTVGSRVVSMGDSTSTALTVTVSANVLAFVVAVYRIVQSFSNATSEVNDTTVFYVVECAVEAIVSSIFVFFNVKELVESPVGDYAKSNEMHDYGHPPPQLSAYNTQYA
jgi:hypothetical protein